MPIKYRYHACYNLWPLKVGAFLPQGFKLHFYFDSNDYFSNSELTKEYEMKCAPPEQDPFSFDGPEIYRCKGNGFTAYLKLFIVVRNQRSIIDQ